MKQTNRKIAADNVIKIDATYKLNLSLYVYPHCTVMKATFALQHGIFLVVYSLNTTHLVFISKRSSVVWSNILSTFSVHWEPSPVPELSFLPAPYRGWTRDGVGRKESSGTGLLRTRTDNAFDFWYDFGKTVSIKSTKSLILFWVRGTTRFEIYAHYTRHLFEWIYRERCVGLYVWA